MEAPPGSASGNAGRWPSVWLAAAAGIVLIAGIDFQTGVELRVLPLYYVPISLVAWYRGQPGALVAALLCTLSWLLSNLAAGLSFSHYALWVANTLLQGMSFAVVGVLIARLREALRRERELSRVDPLTALPNRRAFYEAGERLLALCRRDERPITVAYVDLDDFKVVNDRRGHEAGDALLRDIAGRLNASIRSSDVAARVGGDEFVVLFPGLAPERAPATLERLRSSLDEAAAGHGPVTASIGGVTFVAPPADVESIVQQADACMYAAKATGKDRVHHEVVTAQTSSVPV